jgi:hypothetical protein
MIGVPVKIVRPMVADLKWNCLRLASRRFTTSGVTRLASLTGIFFWQTDGTAVRRWEGRQPMAMNFKIFQLKSKNSVHLTLDGDFDGTSAHELVNTLKSYGPDVEQVFINTNGLRSIHPFGQVVLRRNLSGLYGRRRNLVFIGDHGRRLSRPWIQ